MLNSKILLLGVNAMMTKSNKKPYSPMNVSKLGSLADITQAASVGKYSDGFMMRLGNNCGC